MKITPGTSVSSSAGEDAESAADEERWVRCAACGGRLAPERARIDVGGRHEHEFMNPSGIRFVVLCYATAPGCVPEGERSTVWTWFPGRAWQVALCKTCGAHVGWSFHVPGSSDSFHGLIRDRIA